MQINNSHDRAFIVRCTGCRRFKTYLLSTYNFKILIRNSEFTVIPKALSVNVKAGFFQPGS